MQVENRLSPIKNKEGLFLKRKFLGEIHTRSTKEKKEKEAYVRGDAVFTYGKDELGNPKYFKVRQNYYYD